MRRFSILEPPSEKFATHPREDFFSVSEKHPIFVVADGVTLIQFLIDKKEYPNPSSAGDVARIFCEEALKAAETRYESFRASAIKEVFRVANEAVGEYNRKHGRTKETVDYWDTDFYAATAALVVIKGSNVYWGSLCDSYVMHFDSEGMARFRSPDCSGMASAEAPDFTGDPHDEKAKTHYTWRVKRNGVNERGQPIGYGVLTGEPETLLYLASGSFSVREGDLVSVLTDGFEEYLKLPEFISFFAQWPSDLESRVRKFTATKTVEDPERFGRERTLIMIAV